jgi:putative nucleotidyltransferase with HDIG domain
MHRVGTGLLPDDWRGPAAPAAPIVRAVARTTTQPRLYRHARPTTLAAEKMRAADITREAKTVVESTFRDVRLGRAITSAALSPIVESIAASIARNPIAIPSVTRLKSRHEYTYLHSVAVCGLMIGLAHALHLPDADMHDIGMAGLLHDIGKARVPTLLLDKPGPLDDAELAVVKSHAERGHDLLTRSGGLPEIALDVCAHHHERIDGTGYPFRLSQDHLSVHARMGAVCDVYDAVTSARAYKPAWTQSEALEWMASTHGQFDPHIFDTFRRMIATFPTGSIVRLQSGRLALVLDDAATDPIAPPAVVFLCAETRRSLAWCRVETTRDPIVGIERPERWGLQDWPATRQAIFDAF